METAFKTILSELSELMRRGIMYPEAHMRVCLKYGLSASQAKEINDTFNSRRSWCENGSCCEGTNLD